MSVQQCHENYLNQWISVQVVMKFNLINQNHLKLAGLYMKISFNLLLQTRFAFSQQVFFFFFFFHQHFKGDVKRTIIFLIAMLRISCTSKYYLKIFNPGNIRAALLWLF